MKNTKPSAMLLDQKESNLALLPDQDKAKSSAAMASHIRATFQSKNDENVYKSGIIQNQTQAVV